MPPQGARKGGASNGLLVVCTTQPSAATSRSRKNKSYIRYARFSLDDSPGLKIEESDLVVLVLASLDEARYGAVVREIERLAASAGGD